MNALISPATGFVLYTDHDDERTRVVNVVEGTHSTSDEETVAAILSNIVDWYSTDKLDPDAIEHEARCVYWNERAVSLMVDLLAGLSPNLALRILLHVDSILADKDKQVKPEGLLNQLLMAPLKRPDAAADFCKEAKRLQCDQLAKVLNAVYSLQEPLRSLTHCWLGMSTIKFEPFPGGQQQLWYSLVQEGVVRKVLSERTSNRIKSVISSFGISHYHGDPNALRALAGIANAIATHCSKRLDPEDHQIISEAFKESTGDETCRSPSIGYNEAISTVDRISQLVAKGDDVAARKMLEQLVNAQLNATDDGKIYLAKSLCNIASKCSTAHRSDFARSCLEHALEINPTDPVVLSQIGTFLKDRGRYDDALVAYKRSIELTDKGDNESLVRTQSAIADIFTRQGHYQDAIEQYIDVSRVVPRQQTRIALADVYRRSGDLRRAMDIYAEELKHDSRCHRAIAGKAEIAKRRGKIHRGIELYNKLLRADFVDPDSLNVYKLANAHLLKLSGQPEKALALINEVVYVQPYNIGANLQKASIHFLMNDRYRANQVIEFVRSLPDGQPDTAWLASYLENWGRLKNGTDETVNAHIAQHIDSPDVLPEDRQLLNLGAACAFIRADDIASTKERLETVCESENRYLSHFHKVLALHTDALEHSAAAIERQAAHLLRLPRMPRALKYTINSLAAGDFAAATEFEMTFFLMAA